MNEETHIDQNIAIASEAEPNSLTDTERVLARRAAAKYRELMPVDCTGCGYCMPCPADVMIPEIFEIYSKMHLFGTEAEARFMYAGRLSGQFTATGPRFASQCTQCGRCVERCPQHIAIPETLEKVVEELEGPDLEERIAAAKAAFAGETP